MILFLSRLTQRQHCRHFVPVVRRNDWLLFHTAKYYHFDRCLVSVPSWLDEQMRSRRNTKPKVALQFKEVKLNSPPWLLPFLSYSFLFIMWGYVWDSFGLLETEFTLRWFFQSTFQHSLHNVTLSMLEDKQRLPYMSDHFIYLGCTPQLPPTPHIFYV